MKLNPGPLKNEPIITRTAQNIRWTVIKEIANFLSSGLFEGFLSMYGARISKKSANQELSLLLPLGGTLLIIPVVLESTKVLLMGLEFD